MMRLTWLNMTWRTGRRNKRNLYVQVGPEPSGDNDVCIGLVDSPSLAERIVADHNASLVQSIRYLLIRDDDGHWYLVAEADRDAFDRWVDLGDGDEPASAVRLAGSPSNVTFEAPLEFGKDLDGTC